MPWLRRWVASRPSRCIAPSSRSKRCAPPSMITAAARNHDLEMKIIVAMSGGVDSSVAAALLAREGHEVVGVTLRLLPGGATGFGCCGAPEDVARRQAQRRKDRHPPLRRSTTPRNSKRRSSNYFVNSYLVGETPNPCLACNRYIKFDKLKTFAASLGASHIATGHYARIENDGGALPSVRSGRPVQGSVLRSLQLQPGGPRLHAVSGRRKAEDGDPRDCPAIRSSQRGQEGQPGNLLCAEARLRAPSSMIA